MRKAFVLGLNAISVAALGLAATPASAAWFNDPPVAVNDTLSVRCYGFFGVGVLGNDTDPDGDTLTIISVSHSRNEGNVDIAGGGTGLEYESGSPGTDTIFYTVSDGHGGEDTAMVSVTITGSHASCIP